jgi:hypothetical protein
MSPLFEIFAQLFFLYIAAWLIFRAYIANSNAKSIKEQFSRPTTTEDALETLNLLPIVGGFLSGVTIFILFVNKIIVCGFVCGTLLP